MYKETHMHKTFLVLHYSDLAKLDTATKNLETLAINIETLAINIET